MTDAPKSPSRRRFLTTTAATATTFGILGCKKTAPPPPQRTSGVFIGEDPYRYEVIHDWAILPDQYSWQITHNCAVDSDGNLYVIHEGQEALPDHPAIFVFDPQGDFVRAFSNDFQGGGHGLEVRKEGNEEFLYVTGYQKLKTFAKLTLTGEQVWKKRAPMDSGAYAAGEDTLFEPKDRSEIWARNRFLPTNFAFLPDGGFLLADGYGAWMIHRYDKDANYVSSFGGEGTEPGKFKLPHGLWIDTRKDEPAVVVADRTNGRVQWLTLDGEHIKTVEDTILPANIDQHGDTLLVPDLSARISLFDKDDNLIHLGEDEAWRTEVMKDGKAMRRNPEGWVDGKFVHPHDACYDKNGDIYVAEWVASGRISKLRLVS
ncbi:MAG: hypothetical protein HKN23_10595 [Verrucomicrobiales bacterium]|nr:hypothetical protein [Verrucomicrobiales bacterium]